MCFYTIRCGSCVTGVNEQRARADTQAAGGSRASWRCSAPPVPPVGFHRERPRSPSAGVQIIARIKSVAVSSSPSESASRAVMCSHLQGWAHGAGGAWGWQVPGVGASHVHGCLPWPGFSVLSPVAQVADSSPQSTAPQIKPSCPAPAPCVRSDHTCPALRLAVASLHLSGVFSPFLFTCAHRPGLLPRTLTFVSLCICLCQSDGPIVPPSPLC